jgi:hypothetical protein
MIGAHRVNEINNHRQESEKYETFYRGHQLDIKDQILGKWAILDLDFTPASKKLFSIEIQFHNTGGPGNIS